MEDLGVTIAPIINKAVDVKEAASLLGVSRSSFYCLLKTRGFPQGARLGRRRVWLTGDLFAYLEKQTPKGGR